MEVILIPKTAEYLRVAETRVMVELEVAVKSKAGKKGKKV